MTLNIRSFSQNDASGHGLSCASKLSGFDPAEAGKRAGENAKKMVDAKEPEAGEYEVLMSPTVASNLVDLIGGFSSAFSVEAGIFFFVGKPGKKGASQSFSLPDHRRRKGGPHRRGLRDEGVTTPTNPHHREGSPG